MVVKHLYFVRHGETDDNKAGIMQGCKRDTPINDKGREQARSLQQSGKLPRNAAVFSSPMKRALETCQIATLKDHDDIVLEERLVEQDYGEWTGKLKKDCIEKLKTYGTEITNLLVSIDEIETWTAFTKRIHAALNDLINEKSETKIVFLHVGVIKAITDIVLPKLEIDSADKSSLLTPAGNCAVYKLTVDVKPEYISYTDFVNV